MAANPNKLHPEIDPELMPYFQKVAARERRTPRDHAAYLIESVAREEQLREHWENEAAAQRRSLENMVAADVQRGFGNTFGPARRFDNEQVAEPTV